MFKEVLHADYSEPKRIVEQKKTGERSLSTDDQGIPDGEHMLPMLAAQLQCTVTPYVETPFDFSTATDSSSLIKVQTATENRHCSNGALNEPKGGAALCTHEIPRTLLWHLETISTFSLCSHQTPTVHQPWRMPTPLHQCHHPHHRSRGVQCQPS